MLLLNSMPRNIGEIRLQWAAFCNSAPLQHVRQLPSGTLAKMAWAGAIAGLTLGVGVGCLCMNTTSAKAAPPHARAQKGDAGTRDGVGGTSASAPASTAVNVTSGFTSAAPVTSSISSLSLAPSGQSASGQNRSPGPSGLSNGGSFEKEVVGTSQRFLRPVPGMGRSLEREINSEKFQELLFQALGLKLCAPAMQPHHFVVSLEQGANSPLAFRLSMKTKRYTDVQMDSIFRLAMNYLQRRMEGHTIEFSLVSTTALADSTPAHRDSMTTALLRQYPWLPESWLRVVDEDGHGGMVQYALVDGGFGWHFTVFKSQGRFVVEAEMRDALEVNNAYQKLFAEARTAARSNLVRQGIDSASKNWSDFYAIELKTVLRVKYNLDWKSPADIAALYVNQH